MHEVRGGEARATSLRAVRQLLRFGWVQAQCCLFAALFFAGLALVRLVPLPGDPADALLLWCLAVTLVLWLVRWETGREVGVIVGFHLVGLALELFKVDQGSWSYPDTGVATVGGVPLYSGFMYAAVGSYVCQAWRRLDLRITGYRPWGTAAVAALVYLNFFTSHATADVRLPLALALLVVTWRTEVRFTVGHRRYAMPLALSFVLIGFFLWVAENAATLLRAWQYPSQESVWTLVHAAKVGSWSLLVVVSIVLVAAVKAQEGRLYGAACDRTVLRAYDAPPQPLPPQRFPMAAHPTSDTQRGYRVDTAGRGLIPEGDQPGDARPRTTREEVPCDPQSATRSGTPSS